MVDLKKLHVPWYRHQISGKDCITYCAVNWDTGDILVEALVKLDGNEVLVGDQIPEEQKKKAIRSIVYWMRGDDPSWGSQHQIDELEDGNEV